MNNLEFSIEGMQNLASGQMIVVMGKILTGSNATLNFRFVRFIE